MHESQSLGLPCHSQSLRPSLLLKATLSLTRIVMATLVEGSWARNIDDATGAVAGHSFLSGKRVSDVQQ